jgi:pimeloyl-ACP methyl ester carboxylesterase
MATKFMEVSGGMIAYDDEGSGPLVVCVPSMGDLRREFRFLIPQLVSAGYRAVAMDVRGHGETSVTWQDYSVAGVGNDILELIRALDAGPAVIIGDSMAGGAAVWAAAEGPNSVSGLLLIDPFVRGNPTWLSKLIVSILAARPWGPALWLGYFSTLYPTHKPGDFAQYKVDLRANLARPGRLEALRQMLNAPKAASEERLPRVQAPVLVLMGSKDPDFKAPEDEAKWVAGSLHGAYRMIEGAGHYPQAEFPEITGPLALAFLQSVKEAREKVHA